MRALLAAVALMGGLSTGAFAKDDDKKPAGPDWKITGWETTTCCCKDICPCRFNEKPTHMECESTISIHIDKGFYGDTKLENVNFILVGRGFDDSGKGWNKLYVDKKVTPEQQKAIGGILTTIVSSYDPKLAGYIFGQESRGMKAVDMTFTKSADGLIREVKAPGVCHIRARLGKVPGSKTPMYLQGVLTEFSPIFYPAAEVLAVVQAPEVVMDHPEHHRAEVEDFTVTRDDYAKKRIGFQAFTGRGGCIMPGK